jgi:glycogen operon protein
VTSVPGETGASSPLGATVLPGGVNFSAFSKHATGIELLLFDHPADATPSRVISLDPRTNRTYHYWHTFVRGVGPGQIYAYRAHGPFAPDKGLRFDAGKVLLDPYGLAVAVPDGYDRVAACRPGVNSAVAMKSVVADTSRYDWEGDRPIQRPFVETVIYELHVGGFTRHRNSGVAADKRGTYAGLIERIPYLVDLGVTPLNSCPSFNSIRRTLPAAASTTGATSRSRSSRLTTPTARAEVRSRCSTSSAIWSKRSIGRAWK